IVIALARSERSAQHAPEGDTAPGFEADRDRSHWRGLSPAALIAALGMCLVIYEGQQSSGPLRWSHRMVAAAAGIEAVQRPPGDGSDPYAPLLAGVPRGATVAVWISEPERLDYARHRFIDLRTPAGAHDAAPLLAQLPAEFLLIEADDAHRRGTQGGLLHRVVCRSAWQLCADDLEAIALQHPTIARRDHLRIVDLRR
ncbi:MAG TPA: hypothetical protein VLM79_12590, partial [Kofleriaceae bacterium]|nr:hypothetical protein [Kofleriaceae bacterium]